MTVPNINLLKVTLEKLAKELKDSAPDILEVDRAWFRGYQAGQWDAGFHIEQLLLEFFD